MKRIIVVACLAALVAGAAFADDGAEEPKKAGWATFFNIVPGLGIGSFAQGDLAGGLLGLGGEVAGVGLFGYGLVQVFGSIIGGALAEVFTLGYADADEEVQANISKARVYLLSGIGVWAGVKIFEIIRPSWFASSYNDEHGLAALDLSPTLTADEGGISPGLVVKLSY